MKRLGLGVSKVDWLTTFDFVVIGGVGQRARRGPTAEAMDYPSSEFERIRTSRLDSGPNQIL